MGDTAQDAQAEDALRQLLGARLLAQRGRAGGWGIRLIARVALRIAALLDRRLLLERRGPDGTLIVLSRLMLPGARAWTAGNLYFLDPEALTDHDELALTMIHEYVHVLQYRAEGLVFLWRYLRQGLWGWGGKNAYERQAEQVEAWYRQHPDAPKPWYLPR